ncbi:MAG: Inner membrane symporter YicJ [Firmicutes bacterium ADurb.Bin262]|nr:MAG: Inner membrane symporter YicJ [Firmicutes bacterium ADurb.Bin262]
MPSNASMNQTRRYVSTKETVGYVLFDSSKTFNINQYTTRFLLDVVKIDLGWQTVINAINSVWDIANDSFIGAIVDKTRTRFGKFRPYLIVFGILGTFGTIFYWLTPMFFGSDPYDAGKFVYWLLLAMLREGGGTFRSIAESGLISTVTPNPDERMGILTKSEVFSSFYENVPEFVLAALIDMVNHNMIKTTLRTVFVSIGVFTTLVSGVFAMLCFLTTKERVQQSVQRPDIKQGFLTIIRSKPLRIIMISDLLNALTVSTGMDNYYLDVLGSLLIKTVISIPSTPAYYLSYSYLAWSRKRFATKSLWIFGQHLGHILSLLVFLFGSIGGRGPGGWFRSMKYMVPVFMVKETLWQLTSGMKKILPREILNEALDYCEWEYGYRTEGMSIAAKNMITKIVTNTNSTFTTLILKKIGYNITAGFGGQSDKTKYLMFAMCTLVPSLTGLISMIPKFFYNINRDCRERMYVELNERRAALNRDYEETGVLEEAAGYETHAPK